MSTLCSCLWKACEWPQRSPRWRQTGPLEAPGVGWGGEGGPQEVSALGAKKDLGQSPGPPVTF